jgi:hypothetical protein
MIPSLHRLLLRCLVVLLVTQGVAAPTHALERLAWTLSMPLCGGGAAALQHDGDGPAQHHGADACVMCHAVPQGPVPPGPVVASPGAGPLAVAPAWPAKVAEILSRSADNYAARAPPGA